LNFGQHAPIRVLYPAGMLARLAKNVPNLPAGDKIGLLSDSFALCKAGLLDPVQLVQLLGGFQGETNDKVWAELMACLDGLDKLVRLALSAETTDAFIDFAAKLVGPASKQVGWETGADDSDNKKQLRSTLVGGLGKYCFKDPAVVSEALKLFEAFIAAPTDAAALSADIRAAVLSIAAKSHLHEASFDKLMAAHGQVTDAAVRTHIYYA